MIAYWFYRLSYFCAIHLPLKVAYGIAVFLSLLKYTISPRDRDAVIGNLRKILPVTEQKDITLRAKQVFIGFGKYLIEFFRFSLLNKENIKNFIKTEGLEHVEAALSRGKGVIILAVHVGNWELGGVFMALMGYPIVAVALPHRHPKVDAFFNHQRQKMGMGVIPSAGVGVRHIYDALKNNRIVALVGDRDFANGGKRMPFLGETKIIPRGPAVLALRTGAAIVPGFVLRQKDDTHILKFLPALRADGSEDEIMARCVKTIEEVVRQYPQQWLMFREYWKE
jgi:KDO2-lipid IV(A) lauroyltransferase